MSELKARTAYSIAMEEEDLESSGTTLVYLKSEADKVIAEKDKEIAELKALNHELCERVTENHEIRLHWEEIEQTSAENERIKARIAELEEERRWRKCSEGLPLEKQRVLFLARYKNNVREWIGDFRHNYGMEDFAVFYTSAPGWGCEFLIDEVIGWIPLPSAPKEGK